MLRPAEDVSSAAIETEDAVRRSAFSRADLLQLAVVGVGLVYVFTPTVLWLIDRWTLSIWHNMHGMFVAPVVGYLIWRELESTHQTGRAASALGFVFVVPALLGVALDAGMHTQLISAFCLVLLMPGLSLLFLGWDRTHRIAFPLLFLLFMLPIPLSFTEQAHLGLRQIATTISSGIVDIFGIPVFTEGTTIHLAGVSLEVADACSGFSTLYASMAVACLVAYVTPSWPRRLTILGIAAPLAIGANVLRVTALILLVLWQGESILDTPIHTISGLATFAAALPVILWIGQDREAGR